MTDPTPPPPATERDGVDMLREAYARWEGRPPLLIGVFRQDAYLLVCGLQLLLRHPDISEHMRERFEAYGRLLQEEVSDTPELYTMLESGWNPAADEPRDG